MTKKVLYLLGIAFTILLGTWLQYSFCCKTCNENKSVNNETKQIEVEIEKPKTNESTSPTSGFSFTTETSSFKTIDNFLFLSSDFNLLLPISDSINLGIEQLKSSLINSTSKFKINGSYTSEEENNSIFPDLGIARATSVKNYLISKGIPENKLSVSSSLANNPIKIGDTLTNSISYSLSSKISTTENISNNWESVKKEINSNPLRLYFNTGQSKISLTQAEKDKLGQIINYINNVSDSKILITGHTDNTTGPNNTNEYYSAKRAEFAKEYLVTNGISANKIVTQGKTASMPIADNNSEEGRAKNRRAEISIQ
ncbi:OmpA family protein [Flavobacterium okayamense]|uniref:OmpA-like domain-containing protein n=1 Tax=Flavobacterium okayamense TaxID=2830782 RepID=A0ABN6HSG8_9FLAO|nr:OmpA family protein [Flavobacterium okayamense]BCY27549.1 hypothetical protein KK2020170_04170 [Flavobacterium okayamense]